MIPTATLSRARDWHARARARGMCSSLFLSRAPETETSRSDVCVFVEKRRVSRARAYFPYFPTQFRLGTPSAGPCTRVSSLRRGTYARNSERWLRRSRETRAPREGSACRLVSRVGGRLVARALQTPNSKLALSTSSSSGGSRALRSPLCLKQAEPRARARAITANVRRDGACPRCARPWRRGTCVHTHTHSATRVPEASRAPKETRKKASLPRAGRDAAP